MGSKERAKGLRVEREIVHRFKDAGVDAERVPLSGAAGGSYSGDVSFGDWVAEVKARKDGAGFKKIEEWLGDNDCLILKKNNADPMVVLPWDQFIKLYVAFKDSVGKDLQPTEVGVAPTVLHGASPV